MLVIYLLIGLAVAGASAYYAYEDLPYYVENALERFPVRNVFIYLAVLAYFVITTVAIWPVAVYVDCKAMWHDYKNND